MTKNVKLFSQKHIFRFYMTNTENLVNKLKHKRNLISFLRDTHLC